MPRGIDRERRPRVGGAGELRTLGAPFLVNRIGGIAGNRVPAPQLLPGSGVEGPDRAELDGYRPIVADRGADDDFPIQDRGWRGHQIVAPTVTCLLGKSDPLQQVDRAVLAEILAELTGRGVESEQPAVEGRGVNASCALGVWRLARINPQ